MTLPALIQKIEELRQEFAGYQPLPQEVQEKLNKKFRLEFNYNSNHIEGNTLTYGETELYLIFEKTTGNHDSREYEEMKGSDVALKMVQEYATDKERTLTEEFIKNLNKIILVRPYWANAITPDGQPTRREISIGDYKKHHNSVKLQSGEMFHYAKPEETPMKMGELIAWYREELEKSELHPIALAALLHYKFVLIHPFDDGNGRISRLLMNYVLYSNGLPPVIIKSANKKDYLFALNQADTGNINAFVEYVASQMLWSLEMSIKAAKGESVEEQDDLEKEISVWKKELQGKNPHDVIPKSEAIINAIYYEQLRPFVELLESKIFIFQELFNEYSLTAAMNNKYEFNMEGKSYIDSYFTGPYGNFANANIPTQNIDSIEFRLFLNGFKKDARNPFGLDVSIKIIFYTYNYEITFRSASMNFALVKAYNQFFNKEDQEKIAKEIQEGIYNYIKSRTERPS